MHQNPSSLHLMREVLDWLGDRTASARLEVCQRITLIPFVNRRNNRLRGVTLVNCGIEPLREIVLRIRRPEGTEFHWRTPETEAVEIPAEPGENQEEFTVVLPGLAAWHIGTFFCQ